MSKGQPHCCYCGRFIKYKDFEEKKAFQSFDVDYSGYETEFAYHVECKNKAKING